jgi:hypothetical protein
MNSASQEDNLRIELEGGRTDDDRLQSPGDAGA